MTVSETKIIILFLTTISIFKAAAQESNHAQNAIAEKIYIQTDGLVYTTDQTIWFKGVVLNGFDLKPSKTSGVLYVDLIDTDEVIVSSKKLKLEKGITHGSFALDSFIHSGKYQIRAYTNWNLNFGEEFMFKEYIDVFPSETTKAQRSAIADLQLEERNGQKFLKGSVQAKILDSLHNGAMRVYIDSPYKKDSLLLKNKTGAEFQFEYAVDTITDIISLRAVSSNGKRKIENVLVDTESIDLQFFPEGGNLIDGVISKVGFKAVSISRKGKKVSGKIFSKNGKQVQSFSSTLWVWDTFSLSQRSTKSIMLL